MKVLLVSQIFDPEPAFKGLFLARGLRALGHEVSVLTAFPNYPGGKIYPGYALRAYQREVLDDIVVHRVPHFLSHDTRALRRITTYSTFAAASALAILALERPDVVYVNGTPATTSFPAFVARRLRGVPFLFDIQDVWPDSVASTGMLSNPRAMDTMHALLRHVYDSAAGIIVPSPGLVDLLAGRGVPRSRLHLVYNWCDEDALRQPSTQTPEEFRRTEGLSDDFVVTFAGTMGRAQALESVIDAARLVEERAPRVRFVFIGDGVEVDALRRRSVGSRNLRFLPRRPMAEVSPVLRGSDALMVHLRDAPIFRCMIPSKTQAYMALGRPLVMAVAGDGNALVDAVGCGVTCAPEDPLAMANAVVALASRTGGERAAMGLLGQRWYEERMAAVVGLRTVDRLLRATQH